MIKAAGIFFLLPNSYALFIKRGGGSDHPYEWAFPGGQLEEDETLEECAIRECEEETGLLVKPAQLTLHTRSVAQAENQPATSEGLASEPVDFTTYLAKAKAPFIPHECDEHVGWAWCDIKNPPLPLHPGCQVAIDRLTCDELGVARLMSQGLLTSPQRYENMFLWNIRITGTGVAYRQALSEFVFRNPENYLNDEFVQRCMGLTCIWEHPPGATMTSEEFGNRVVGSIMLPYIKGQDVWGVAKIYDQEMNDALMEDEASTSPTVVFRDPSVNTKMKLEDGKVLLIEGVPTLLDHVALLPNKGAGVWDKLGDPVGVDRSGVEEYQDSQRSNDNLLLELELFNISQRNKLALARR